jgi:hypothetical protein
MSRENFEPTVNSDEVKKDNLEKAKKLAKFCSENGNPIKIVDYGENFGLERVDLEQPDLTKLSLDIFKNYISGPIFTDAFLKDNNKRRKWEKEIENLMEKKIEKYYQSNRISINNYSGVIGILNHLLINLKDFEIKNKLLKVKNEIPEELIEKNEKQELPYLHLENDGKIEVIKKFSEIVQKLISILENKS